jgi:hypothetical protein
MKDKVEHSGSVEFSARVARIQEEVRRLPTETLREYDQLERAQEALLARSRASYQPALPDHVESPVTVEAEPDKPAGL